MTTLLDELPGQDEKQLERIKTLEPGRLFMADFPRGWSYIFPSAKHPGYWHVYYWMMAFSQFQWTQRPVTPEGVLMNLHFCGLSLDEYRDQPGTMTEITNMVFNRDYPQLEPVRDIAQLLKGSA